MTTNPSSILSTTTSPTRPFLNPSNPLRFHPHSLPKRQRFRVAFPRNCAASSTPSSSPSSTEAQSPTGSDVFGPSKELSGIQPLVDKLSPPLRLATSAIVVAGAAFSGFQLGSRLGGNRNVAIGGAAVLSAAGGAVAYSLNAAVPEVAAVRLHDYVAASDDPGAVNREEIEAIAKKFVAFFFTFLLFNCSIVSLLINCQLFDN